MTRSFFCLSDPLFFPPSFDKLRKTGQEKISCLPTLCYLDQWSFDVSSLRRRGRYSNPLGIVDFILFFFFFCSMLALSLFYRKLVPMGIHHPLYYSQPFYCVLLRVPRLPPLPSFLWTAPFTPPWVMKTTNVSSPLVILGPTCGGGIPIVYTPPLYCVCWLSDVLYLEV